MNHFILEKIDYKAIYAHRDWDGVIGGGLILRIFDLPISFVNRVEEAVTSIIIEVPFSLDAYIEKCLIIDHHDCKREPLKSLHFGNHVICDETYSSVSSLIVDYFDLDAPDYVLDAIDVIEVGDIEGDELAYRMFIAFVSSMHSFPFNHIAKEIKHGRWDKVIAWVNNRSSSKEAEMVKRLAEKKTSEAKEVVKGVELITYNSQDPLDIGAARLALMKIEKRSKIGIILGLEKIYVRYGLIASMRKRINLIPLFQELIKLSWRAGGRAQVGGFQITYDITLEQAINAIKESLVERGKEIGL